MQYALTIVANDSGLELIAHLDCRVRRRAHGAHAEEECGDSRIWRGYYLVTTRGVSSFALVTSDSFPAKSTSVFVFGRQCELCQFCLTLLEMNSCCTTQCVLCKRRSAHQVIVVVVPSLVISSSCARDCVFMTRDMLRIMAQENLMCSSRPTDLQRIDMYKPSRPTDLLKN